MARYFELKEFLKSDTAKWRGIDNTPGFDEVEHLRELTEKVLDPLRAAWGSPLNVSSGYRCEKLNAAVGGSVTSAHLLGYAADIVPAVGRLKDFIDFAERWLRVNDIAFDQSIREVDRRGREWWHIGLKNGSGQQRRQFLALTKY